MTENVKKVFEMLGVEPKEEFLMWGEGCSVKHKFVFDENLNLTGFSDGTCVNANNLIHPMLIGKYCISKMVFLSEKEKAVINMIKAYGYKYLARDKCNDVYCYSEKPVKLNNHNCWDNEDSIDPLNLPYHLIKDDFKFLKWEDTEPFNIEDIEL